MILRSPVCFSRVLTLLVVQTLADELVRCPRGLQPRSLGHAAKSPHMMVARACEICFSKLLSPWPTPHERDADWPGLDRPPEVAVYGLSFPQPMVIRLLSTLLSAQILAVRHDG